MRIDESRLRRIIREEARRVLAEGDGNLKQDIHDKLSMGRGLTRYGVIKSLEHKYRPREIEAALSELVDGGHITQDDSGAYRPSEGAGFEEEEEGLEDDPFMDSDEGDEDEDEGTGEEMMTVEDVIERFKDEGPRSWMRVSNDFHEMAEGGMEDIAEKYYPGLTPDDFREIAERLDDHFGMD